MKPQRILHPIRYTTTIHHALRNKGYYGGNPEWSPDEAKATDKIYDVMVHLAYVTARTITKLFRKKESKLITGNIHLTP